MKSKTSKSAGKYFAIIVLAISLVIAVAGLYLVLTEFNPNGDVLFPLALSILVAILILLILTMMLKIIAGLKKGPEDSY